MTIDLRFQAVYSFDTLTENGSVIIHSYHHHVQTCMWTPRGGLKVFRALMASPLKWTRTRESSLDLRVPINSSNTLGNDNSHLCLAHLSLGTKGSYASISVCL